VADNNGFLTVEQAAELLQVHPNTVYLWLQDGKLAGAKIGGTWRIRRSDIDAFWEKEGTGTPTNT
jgi:excisionase family DNA binding protein